MVLALLLPWSFYHGKTELTDAEAQIQSTLANQHFLNTDVNELVLETRYGLQVHYDALVNATKQLNKVVDQLNIIQTFSDESLRSAATDYIATIKHRVDHVEEYKSENATLRNSYRYIPVLVEEYVALMHPEGDTKQIHIAPDAEQIHVAHNFLSDLLILYTNDGFGNDSKVQKSLNLIREYQPASPETARVQKDILVHADRVIKLNALVGKLIRTIVSDDWKSKLAALQKTFQSHIEQKTQTALWFQYVVFVDSILISMLLLLIFYRLYRSRLALHNSNIELAFQKYAIDQHAIVTITDVRGDIKYVNDLFCAISGYSRDELLGQNHRIIKSGAHSPEFFKHLWKTIANGHVWHGVIKNKKKDGSFYWVESTIVPDLNEQGKPVQYIAIRTDVSDIKKMEEEKSQLSDSLLNMNNELESRVEERTRELEQASQSAQAANAAKSNFLANISHEIRTPMNAIIGMSYQALQTNLNASQKNYIGKTHHAAKDLLRLLNDILDYSKIESGKLHFESIDFRLEDLLDNTVGLVAEMRRQKAITLETDIHPETPTALIGDPMRVGQVLLNLVNNAMKFSDHLGHVQIGVESLERSEDTVKIHFWVKDNGIGISEENQAHLFEAFSQVDNSTTRLYGGSGLGLAISEQLTQMMQGEIWFESVLDQGSTFHFTAELGVQTHEPSPRLTSIEDGDTLEPNIDRLQGATILLVEDNEINMELACDLLESNGLIVTTARNGLEAVELLKKTHFDGVLMDCQMPVMDGYEATRLIRKTADHECLPVLALTANVMRGDHEKALAAGMNDVISKPIEINRFFKTMARWITVSQPISEPSPSIQTQPDDNASEIPAIEGVDTAKGLVTFAQNKILYRKLLRKFRKNHININEKFTQDLNNQDYKAAEITAHSIKGAAASLGITSVQESAYSLEKACHLADDDDAIQAALERLLETLDPILHDLEVLDQQSEAAADNQEASFKIGTDQLSDILDDLEQDIRENKISAASKVDQLMPFIRESEQQKVFAELSTALNDYDFDQAENALHQLASVLKDPT